MSRWPLFAARRLAVFISLLARPRPLPGSPNQTVGTRRPRLDFPIWLASRSSLFTLVGLGARQLAGCSSLARRAKVALLTSRKCEHLRASVRPSPG